MINVLVVDDDAMVAELNRSFIGQVPGFHCVGTAATLQQAREFLFNSETPIDLVLLDIYMQQENGLDLLPELRGRRGEYQNLAALRRGRLPDQTVPVPAF